MNNLITPWKTNRLIGFRFFASFFTLFIIPFPLNLIPKSDVFFTWYDSAWEWLVKWTGKHILHLSYDITVLPNGSGDTTFNYVQLLLIVLMAAMIALLWTAADRRPRNYDRLSYWVAVLVRYYLAYTMLSYGFAKVIKTQFPAPSIMRLAQSYGDSSPMGLAWTFMGYSKAYNVFTGLGEVIGGLLLFFRRTLLAGSLLLIAVMSNVVAINFCYDIPVKIYSSLLLGMALWIAWPYRTRMYHFFIKNMDVLPHPFYRVTLKRWQQLSLRVLKFLLIAWAFGSTIYGNWSYYAESGDEVFQQPFEGMYDVHYFIRNNDTLPPLTTDTIRWRKLYITNNGRASIQLMNDTLKRFTLDKYPEKKEWEFISRVDTNYRFTLHYQKPDSTTFLLSGFIGADSMYVQMRKLSPDNFLLMNRGFHWVNEYPFNR